MTLSRKEFASQLGRETMAVMDRKVRGWVLDELDGARETSLCARGARLNGSLAIDRKYCYYILLVKGSSSNYFVLCPGLNSSYYESHEG